MKNKSFDILVNKKNIEVYKYNSEEELKNLLSNYEVEQPLFKMEQDKFIEALKLIMNNSWEKENKLYKALGHEHIYKKSILSSDDGNITFQSDSQLKDALYIYLQNKEYRNFLEFMSTKQYINELYRNPLIKKMQITIGNKKTTLFQSVKKTSGKIGTKDLRERLQNLVAKNFEGIDKKLIQHIQNTIYKETLILYSNGISKFMTNPQIKNLFKTINEDGTQRNTIYTFDQTKYTLSIEDGSYFTITFLETDLLDNATSSDSFAILRGQNQVTNDLIDILYKPLGDSKEAKDFKEKTSSSLESFLKQSLVDYMSTNNKEKRKERNQKDDFISFLFPRIQAGIQGTLGEQMFAACLSEKLSKINQKIKIKIQGQEINKLSQQAHADITVEIDNTKIGIQNKQYNSKDLLNKVSFYEGSYDIFGDSLLRYFKKNKVGGEELLKYFRLQSLTENNQESLESNLEKILRPYFLNFSRIVDPEASEELKNTANNFFVYNFGLVPLSGILFFIIKDLKKLTQKKFFTIDEFSLSKKGYLNIKEPIVYQKINEEYQTQKRAINFMGLDLQLKKQWIKK